MYLSDSSPANGKGVIRRGFISMLVLTYPLPGLSTRRKLKKPWQLKSENKGITPRKKNHLVHIL